MRLYSFRQRFIIKVERGERPNYMKIIFNHEQYLFWAEKASGIAGDTIYSLINLADKTN
jgi:hypothetical protein